MGRDEIATQHHIPASQIDMPSLRHGFGCVHQEIEKHLSNLPAIDFHRPDIPSQSPADLNGLFSAAE